LFIKKRSQTWDLAGSKIRVDFTMKINPKISHNLTLSNFPNLEPYLYSNNGNLAKINNYSTLI